jgi:hypothetical protein
MRDIGILIALLAFAGTAGYVIIWKGPLSEPPRKRPLPVAPVGDTSETAKAQKTPNRGAAPEKVLARRKADLRKNPIEEPPAPATPPAPQVQPPAPPPPFPTSAEISLGTGRAKLLQMFGRPNLKTSGIERDSLVETFVYLQADRSTLTRVHLRDAKVVAVRTEDY